MTFDVLVSSWFSSSLIKSKSISLERSRRDERGLGRFSVPIEHVHSVSEINLTKKTMHSRERYLERMLIMHTIAEENRPTYLTCSWKYRLLSASIFGVQVLKKRY